VNNKTERTHVPRGHTIIIVTKRLYQKHVGITAIRTISAKTCYSLVVRLVFLRFPGEFLSSRGTSLATASNFAFSRFTTSG
jgi:hypothetical protein